MTIELQSEVRNDLGKGASRRLRRENKVPAIIYGAGKEPVNVSLLQNEIQKQLENEAFQRQQTFNRRMVEICQRGLDDGVFKSGLSAELMAVTILGIPHSFLMVWMEQEGVGDDAVVMVNNPPAFWYYTHRPTVVVPAPIGDEETLLAAADRYGVTYVLLDRNWPLPPLTVAQNCHTVGVDGPAPARLNVPVVALTCTNSPGLKALVGVRLMVPPLTP